ncbi:hypothetical protein CsSME_00001480 [Camellia sinensis var. sinensis]
MIIHARVRFEFLEVSATRLASRSPIPSTHRPWHEAIGPFFLPPAKSVGRSALYFVDRPLCWSIGDFCWPDPVHLLYADILIPPLHTRV